MDNLNEDIKILEQSLLTELYGHDTVIVNKKYLGNLIKGYRKKEEENKELKKNYINPSKARISYYDTKKGTEVVIEGFIPKSKVKEKIEGLRTNLSDIPFNKMLNLTVTAKIQVLQELMEEK